MTSQFDQRQAQKKAANKIVRWIIGILASLAIIIALMAFRYVRSSLKPYDASSKEKVVIEIPSGSTNKQIAAILEEKHLIKSAAVFNYYVKAHNYTDFQAGYHELKPSMDFDQIITNLKKEGSMEIGNKVLVKEGVTLEEIGKTIAKNSQYTQKEFLKLMKNEKFLKSLAKQYPDLLSSSMAQNNVRYHLEGYLYPATYIVNDATSLKSLVTKMVDATDQKLKPFYATIKAKDMTVQQVLTLASLVEREGVTLKDRQKIAGVFFNRIDAQMPLQSDISVMYALNTHKEKLYNKDTSVKSPYNLYINKGYGPGPFNSPSIQSISAVLNPTDRDQNYLYFVADLKTGEIYYSHNFEDHTNKSNELESK